jgi:hypothetical protein
MDTGLPITSLAAQPYMDSAARFQLVMSPLRRLADDGVIRGIDDRGEEHRPLLHGLGQACVALGEPAYRRRHPPPSSHESVAARTTLALTAHIACRACCIPNLLLATFPVSKDE